MAVLRTCAHTRHRSGKGKGKKGGRRKGGKKEDKKGTWEKQQFGKFAFPSPARHSTSDAFRVGQDVTAALCGLAKLRCVVAGRHACRAAAKAPRQAPPPSPPATPAVAGSQWGPPWSAPRHHTPPRPASPRPTTTTTSISWTHKLGRSEEPAGQGEGTRRNGYVLRRVVCVVGTSGAARTTHRRRLAD